MGSYLEQSVCHAETRLVRSPRRISSGLCHGVWDVTSVAAKKQCGLDVVLYLFSFIFQELIILPCYLVIIVLTAALFIFRNGAEGVATQRQGRFAALGVSVLASAMGSKMRQGRGVGV